MKIPSDPVGRQALYDRLVRECLASRQERFEFYRSLRNFALFGTADDSGTAYNKVEATLETLTSFIYSPEGVRFVLEVGTSADEQDVFKAAPLAREVSQQWRMTNTNMRFGQSTYWSLVFGTMLMKVVWRKGLARTYLVEPHQFGVLREDVTDLSDQEAFVLCYTTTRTQLEADLAGNPRRASIMDRVGKGNVGSSNPAFAEGLTRLLLTNPVSGVPGSRAQQFGTPSNTSGGAVDGGLAGGWARYSYAPRVDAELVDMCELYVWNDDEQDYQLVTMANPDVVVYDRPQRLVGVGGMPHFVAVRADDKLYDYFWGSSFVAKLAWLQDWRSDDVENIRNLQKKQSDPPVSATGLTGIAEEKLLALRRAGGILGMQSPTAKIETHAPKMPENAFASLDQIDRMFDDMAGIGHILQGRGESGVRSKGQADLMARLGSARPKQRALVLEGCAGDLATLMLRNIQESSDQRFKAERPDGHEGIVFTASQFTTDFEVMVDAHSSSPIFVEDHKADAQQMLEDKVIDRDTFLDMTNPPNKQLLKERLKVIEAKEAAAQRAQMQAEALKHAGGAPSGGS